MADGQVTSTATWLGCIADDITGATDLATNLVQGGVSVVQWMKIPTVEELRDYGAEAIVISLKTRAVAPEHAVEESLLALDRLQSVGCSRFFFKYCSTFDSTDRGNIGPVAEALMSALNVSQTIFCPAFPKNLRTVYQGYLFVGERLLNESGMQSHPLNPMSDANLIRVLAAQTSRKAGLLAWTTVGHGIAAVRERLLELEQQGVAHVIADCLTDADLQTLAGACQSMHLVTGGSAIAKYLVRDCQLNSQHSPPSPERFDFPIGPAAIVAGSCSTATACQVARVAPYCQVWQVDPQAAFEDLDRELERVEAWVRGLSGQHPVMITSTSEVSKVKQLQDRFGREPLSSAIEQFHAEAASILAERLAIRTLIVAGGETAGAVVKRLNVNCLRIGPEICSGVPWAIQAEEPHFALALKSGNFGDDEFFITALKQAGVPLPRPV